MGRRLSDQKPLTISEQIAVQAVLAGKTKKKALLDAGYSEVTATTPQKIFNRPHVRFNMDAFSQMLKEKAEMAVGAITADKVKKANFRDLATGTDSLIKTSRLLDGEATEIVESKMDDEQINRLLGQF